MRLRATVCVALAGAAACAAAPVALADGPMIDVGFDAFAPAQVDALAGETVMWMNVSSRQHTVTANDGSFDSGRVSVSGMFEQRFTTPGAVPYHCTLHPSMTGEIDVYDLLLDRPAAAAAANRSYPVRGLSVLPAGTPVTIESDSGAGFTPVASTTVAADGTFAASLVPTGTAALRAVAGAQASPPVQLVVLDHEVTATARRLKGHRLQVDATVTPAAPGSTVVLELRLRERFGWWPTRTLRLDARSHVRFVIGLRGRIPIRIVLTLPDGATVLATSATKSRY